MSTTNPQGTHRAITRFEPGTRTLNEITQDLNDAVSTLGDKIVRTKTVGGQQISYIPWYIGARLLTAYAPGWKYEITSVHMNSVGLCMTVRLLLVCSDGEFHRDASGWEIANVTSYGDPSSNAEGMALKRAAAKFHLGLGLYQKKQGQGQSGQPQHSGAQTQNSGQGAFVTPKQLGLIGVTCKELGIDPNTESLAYMKKETEDFTTREASTFITHLKAIQAGTETFAGYVVEGQTVPPAPPSRPSNAALPVSDDDIPF